MFVVRNVPLQPLNSFGIAARATALVRVRGEADVRAVLADAELAAQPRFVLGGGSNIVLTGDLRAVVLKVEVMGRRVLEATDRHTIVEAGAGENWHDFVTWTLEQGLSGLENLALIPGTVGASPVQSIGAYGVELQNHFFELDAIDARSGELFTLNAAECGFGYRDSVFKHTPAEPGAWPGRARLILRVRFALPKAWKPRAGLPGSGAQDAGNRRCRAHGAPDLRVGGGHPPRQAARSGGDRQRFSSFFKNPTVTPEQCQDIIGRDPKVVHYPMQTAASSSPQAG